MNCRTTLIGPQRLLKGAPHVVRINGSIDASSFGRFTHDFVAAVASGQRVIPVIIHSSGGNVVDAIGIANLIRGSPVPVATIVPSIAQSAAALILSAGTEGYRYAGPRATVMLHQVSLAGISGSLSEVSAETAELRRVNGECCEMMAEYCKKPTDYFKNLTALHRRDLYLNASQAQAHNIINHVGIPKLEVRLHARLWLVNDEWRNLPAAPSERVVTVGGGGGGGGGGTKRKRDDDDDSDSDSD